MILLSTKAVFSFFILMEAVFPFPQFPLLTKARASPLSSQVAPISHSTRELHILARSQIQHHHPNSYKYWTSGTGLSGATAAINLVSDMKTENGLEPDQLRFRFLKVLRSRRSGEGEFDYAQLRYNGLDELQFFVLIGL